MTETLLTLVYIPQGLFYSFLLFICFWLTFEGFLLYGDTWLDPSRLQPKIAVKWQQIN